MNFFVVDLMAEIYSKVIIVFSSTIFSCFQCAVSRNYFFSRYKKEREMQNRRMITHP